MVTLQRALKDFVSRDVKVDAADRKRSVAAVLRWVLGVGVGVGGEGLVAQMRVTDPLFDLLYERLYCAGSAYEGLKVGAANEFDLNVIIRLPFRPEDVRIMHRGAPRGFVVIRLSSSVESLLEDDPRWPVLRRLTSLFETTDNFHDLSRDKFSAWFQSVVDKTLNRMQLPVKITRRCSGPANTLTIAADPDGHWPKLDVDLVPVIPLDSCPGSVDLHWPARVPGRRKNQKCKAKPEQAAAAAAPKSLEKNRKCEATPELAKGRGEVQKLTAAAAAQKSLETCFAVPKQAPLRSTEGQPCQSYADKFFRISLPDAERLMLENRGCVKMMIKIFKAIRDKENWTFVASYYIKTVFMWTIRERPDCDWKEINLARLFRMMVSELLDVFRRRKLPHIFFPDFNILSDLSSGDLAVVRKRLAVIEQETRSSELDERFSIYFRSIWPPSPPPPPTTDDTIEFDIDELMQEMMEAPLPSKKQLRELRRLFRYHKKK